MSITDRKALIGRESKELSELKLFFSPGACSRVPLVMLEKSRARFDTELLVFMRGDHRKPDFLAQNPAGKIPVLLIDGVAISQNIAILTALGQLFPAVGLVSRQAKPIDSIEALGMLARFAGDLHPLVTRIRMPQFISTVEGGPANVKSLAIEAMAFQLKEFEQILEDTNWLGGEDWNALDAYLHWVWFRITDVGFPMSAFPNIIKHYDRTLKQPAFQRALAREQEAHDWLEQNGYAIPRVAA